MIHAVESMPGEGMTLRTVSLQGTQLTASERRRLAFQQQARASANPDLHKQAPRLHEAPQDDPYRYRLDYQSKGTPWLGDVFGH